MSAAQKCSVMAVCFALFAVAQEDTSKLAGVFGLLSLLFLGLMWFTVEDRA